MVVRKKDEALGMPYGTASGRLKKLILFDLVCQLSLNVCYKCGANINTPEELSVEHKAPWLYADNPIETFFDLNNIAYSHLKCNVPHENGAKKHSRKKGPEGTAWCSFCQQFKLISRCVRDKTSWSGYSRECLDCRAARKRRDRKAKKI